MSVLGSARYAARNSQAASLGWSGARAGCPTASCPWSVGRFRRLVEGVTPGEGPARSARPVVTEERAQDAVDLVQIAGRPVLHEERQQLLGVLARHWRAVQRRVRQRPERNLERAGDPG